MLEVQEELVQSHGDRGGEGDADARHGEDAAEPDASLAADRLERPCDRAARAAGEEQGQGCGRRGDRNRPDGIEELRAGNLPRQLDGRRDDGRRQEAEQEGEPGAGVEPPRLRESLACALPLSEPL